jgi:hypothetical protein
MKRSDPRELTGTLAIFASLRPRGRRRRRKAQIQRRRRRRKECLDSYLEGRSRPQI